MLEYFYKLGVTHGHINATNLKIKDDYSLCISEFSIAQFTPEYSKLTEQEQETKKQQIRGYNRDTMSDHLQKVILRESFALDPDFRDDNEDELKLGKCDEFTVRELMQEDWRDLIASFFFSKQSIVITDERIQNFLKQTDSYLNEPGQKSKTITMQVQKALRFIETNPDIIENLIQHLLDEKMLEAVEAISKHFLEIGQSKKNDRIMAFSNMILGEMAAQDLEKAEEVIKAQQYLNDAYSIQTKNASSLSDEELSRVCLSLSALCRHLKNYSAAKRYLELARGKTTDNRMLLNFYQESAKNLAAENLFNQALDSQKRAHDIAKLLFKEDEYEMQECMVNLADAYEKAGDKETAAKLFTEFFQSLDGRDELSSAGTSINSRLSRKLSIKTKTSTSIAIRNKSIAGKDGAKNQKDAGAIQRVAVTLRARQEFNMAEKLMLQAIKVKKGILGTEVNADIAYMYSELAVTYENSEDLKNAISCIKKQIAIYEELKMTETFDFVVANIYFAQLQKENGQVGLGIPNLERGIEIQEKILDKNNRDACYELILNLRTLATYYGMSK